MIHETAHDLINRIDEIYNGTGQDESPPEDTMPADVEARTVLEGVIIILKENPDNTIA